MVQLMVSLHLLQDLIHVRHDEPNTILDNSKVMHKTRCHQVVWRQVRPGAAALPAQFDGWQGTRQRNPGLGVHLVHVVISQRQA